MIKTLYLLQLCCTTLGHGPFSHATESFFGKHEVRSVEIINSTESAVNKVLREEVDKNLPAKVAALIAKKSLKGFPDILFWQKSLISSQLDMDRLDYLRRDALCSGAEYGNFDCFRIIHTMQLEKKVIKGKQEEILVVWPDKSKYALEEYIFARFYMYQSVYYHHTTKGFELLLQKILERAKNLASCEDKTFNRHILPTLRPFLIPGQQPKPNDFLYLTDHILMAQVTLWQNDRDKILSDLAHRLLFRTGLSWTPLQGTEMELDVDKIIAVRNYLEKQGKDHNYYFFKDRPKALVYEPYRSVSATEEQSSVTSIILYDSSWPEAKFKEISDVPGLQRLKAITEDKSSPIMRYYFPKEHEKQIKKMLS